MRFDRSPESFMRKEEVDFSVRVQKYKNVDSHKEAIRGGADCVQVKYDGWWARVVVKDRVAEVYSRQGQLKHTQATSLPNCVLIGEFLKGTNRVVSGSEGEANTVIVFDILEWEGDRMDNQMYGRRTEAISKIDKYASWIKSCVNYHIEFAERLWKTHVDNGNAEGLVYKSMHDYYVGSTVWRKKKEFTMDYVVMRFNEGAGKHKGRLGGIVCGLFEEGILVEKVTVGGGFNDLEREHIWENPAHYYLQVLEVKGWQLFDSGSMRHPNAVRGEDGKLKWREDKSPSDCTWFKV